nr:MAG TPA: hypothetical protein [Caudoviricetes sp.]
MSLSDVYAVYAEKGGRSPQPAQAGKVLCYAHPDNNPSMQLDEKQLHCYTCGEHVNIHQPAGMKAEPLKRRTGDSLWDAQDPPTIDKPCGYLLECGISARVAAVAGWWEDQSGVVHIPYLRTTPSGQVVQIFERTRHEGSKAKYRSPKGVAGSIYMPRRFIPLNTPLVVCEGEKDALALETVGVAALGVPGAQWLRSSPTWQTLLRRLPVRLFVGDGDEAGREMVSEWGGTTTPEGTDLCDLLMRGELEKWLESVG